MNKTVVIISGGMDSVTLLYKCLAEVDGDTSKIKAISFNYGQRHKKELDKAANNCSVLGIEHKIVDITNIQSLLGGSALTDNIDVPEGHYAAENMKLTVVPNRNSIMANIAIGYAVSLDFDRIALGVHAGDHAIYPDCRPSFVKALAVIAEIANYKPIEVYAPFLYMSKGDIVKTGLALDVPYQESWTCYKGEEFACGKCGSCVERTEAFMLNDAIDPIVYSLPWTQQMESVKSILSSK